MGTHTFYRGYIADADNPQPRLESSVDIAKELEENARLNTQHITLRDKLLWVTPDQEFAESMALTRYVVHKALFPEVTDALPAVAQYNLPSLGGVFSVNNSNTPQHIVQSAKQADITVLLPTSDSLEILNSYVAEHARGPNHPVTKNKGIDLGYVLLEVMKSLSRDAEVDVSAMLRNNKSDGNTFADGLRFVRKLYEGFVDPDEGYETIVDTLLRCGLPHFFGNILKYESVKLAA